MKPANAALLVCYLTYAFGISIASGLTFLPKFLEPVKCLFGECCSDALHFNHEYFYGNLTAKLYGQHIAIERFYNYVKAHLEDPSPRRSLVFSLHGFTGVGKNYAASILASSLFRAGEKSGFYRYFDATVDFLFKDSVEFYKAKVLEDIREVVSKCNRAMLVFDEVHKIPAGILDALVPLLGYTESIKGVDYRKAIFVFMGNNGASLINEYVYNHLNTGKNRKSIQYADLRRALSKSVYNEEGAFKFSDLISSHVITAVVPFLPLQEVHVSACIVDAARRLGVEATETMIDFVLSELDWEPEGTRLFSTSGCKLVYDKVGFYLQHRSFGFGSALTHGEL
ncbi:torsin 1A [Echinococcus multilocularis]|uniref:Torsin 1A n=1 Tax=Echinococcus multilocularis TaxID=6211 RepID=A0A068YEG7_ECHMU|nr:torsin 1A [Echinococcus multilocularis]